MNSHDKGCLLDRIRGAVEIRIYDETQFEPGRCCNGGQYGFSRILSLKGQPPRRWRVEHHSTSDFEYCRVCGSFQNNAEHYDSCNWTYLTDQEVRKELSRITDNPGADRHGEPAEYFEIVAPLPTKSQI